MRTAWPTRIGLLLLCQTARAANVEPPPLYVMALPARLVLVAWLPVERDPDLVNLDVRVEVVLPSSCGDRIGGLLLRGDYPPSGKTQYAYDVVIRRNTIGKCDREKPTRVAARQSLVARVPEGKTADLVIGLTTATVRRAGGRVTLDGRLPEGTDPGAPRTAPPTALVSGRVDDVQLEPARRIDDTAMVARTRFTAEWPSCAEPAVGFLGRGDASTRFVLTRFVPIARAPLKQTCSKRTTRTTSLVLLVRAPKASAQAKVEIGGRSATIQLAAPASQ